MRQRRIIDSLFMASGIVGGVLFILGIGRSYYLLIVSLLSLFLGITDFGRRCPLVLSLNHLLIRMRSKRTSPIV